MPTSALISASNLLKAIARKLSSDQNDILQDKYFFLNDKSNNLNVFIKMSKFLHNREEVRKCWRRFNISVYLPRLGFKSRPFSFLPAFRRTGAR